MGDTVIRDNLGLVLHNQGASHRAILVSTFKGPANRATCLEHLEELQRLAETLGVQEFVHKEACHIRKFDASIYIGKGKLEELIGIAKEKEANIVIFDDEISPAQQRTLEKAFGIPVIDRAEVILSVFAQRARTKEAQLQIELAKVRYEAPRLKRLWTHLSRQSSGGGGAHLKGDGEKQIEIDRRLLKYRIEILQRELDEVRAHRVTQRVSRGRSEIPVFAIIGYTNAGKSTLLNSLTDAGVFVEDKLFATLDTTTRKFSLKNHQEILLIDTVGFIRKLPHLLVAAFKSTLEEAVEADILLHLIDASHPMAEEQAATTYEVLKQLGAKDKPIITVINKIDLCDDTMMINRLRLSYPKNVQISALNKEGLDELQEAMIRELSLRRKVVHLRIPQSDYSLITELRRFGNILSQEYEENDILLKVDLPTSLLKRVEPYLF
jgi:GTPase